MTDSLVPLRSTVDLLQEIESLERQLAEANERCAELKHDLRIMRDFGDSLAKALGDRTVWEMRNQEIAQKWRARNQALTRELQLAQVGLTSGCGCPIGQCQRGENRGDGSSCWLQWAESHLARRAADIRISELQRHAVHPSRFAQARSQGKTVRRLLSPEPDGTVREPGIEGTSTTDVTFKEPD